MRVEFIYDADCPNVAAARSSLINAFTKTGVAARWREWERSAPDTPYYAKQYGSPTILVDGKDVAGLTQGGTAANCRVYVGRDGQLSRTPPLEALCAALGAGDKPPLPRGPVRTVLASFPAVGAALLPKLTCPLCWPAYTAVLSALGVGFVDYTPYLLPATFAFLALAVGMLAFGAWKTGRRMPLILGVIACITVLLGKFAVESNWVTNAGVMVLVAATFLMVRRQTARQTVQPASCPACVPEQRVSKMNELTSKEL